MLGKFNQKYPAARLDIRFMDSEQACELVSTGEIELAIVTLPEQVPAVLATKTLWLDDLKFVVNKSHPLAKLKRINDTDLLNHSAVLPAKETFTRGILENALNNKKLKVNIETNYLETLKMLTLAGLGWSIIPDIMIDSKLKILPVKIKIQRRLGSVVHKDRTLSNAGQAILQLAQADINKFTR